MTMDMGCTITAESLEGHVMVALALRTRECFSGFCGLPFLHRLSY